MILLLDRPGAMVPPKARCRRVRIASETATHYYLRDLLTDSRERQSRVLVSLYQCLDLCLFLNESRKQVSEREVRKSA